MLSRWGCMLVGAGLAVVGVMPSAAAGVQVQSLHAGPVPAVRGTPSPPDPCVLLPTDFPRTVDGQVPSDWCVTVQLAGDGGATFDVELPHGTTLSLANQPVCATAPTHCPAETQVGTLALGTTSFFGPREERGALYATSATSLTAILDTGAGRSDADEVLHLHVAAGPFGGQVVRIDPLNPERSTEAGVVAVTPTLLAVRLWGTRGGGVPVLTLGDCDISHRVRLTARPVDAAAMPSAQVDHYLLTQCRDRVHTAFATSTSSDAGRLPPVQPYFATQASRGKRGRGAPLGWLRCVLIPDLPVGAEVQAIVAAGPGRPRRVRTSPSTDAGAVLRWPRPVALTGRTRLVLVVAEPGATTVRRAYRFVRRGDDVRASSLPAPPPHHPRP